MQKEIEVSKNKYTILWTDHCWEQDIEIRAARSPNQAFMTWAHQFVEQTIPQEYTLADCEAITKEIEWREDANTLGVDHVYDTKKKKSYQNTWYGWIYYDIAEMENPHLWIYVMKNPSLKEKKEKRVFTFFLYHHLAVYPNQQEADNLDIAFMAWQQEMQEKEEEWFEGHTLRTCEWLKKAIAREAKYHRPSPIAGLPHAWRWRFLIGKYHPATLYIVETEPGSIYDMPED